jgi:hypothetical protein
MTTPTNTISASDILSELRTSGTISIDAQPVRKLRAMAPTYTSSGSQISFADLRAKTRWLDYATPITTYCTSQYLTRQFADGNYSTYTSNDPLADGVCGYSSLVEGTIQGDAAEGNSVTIYAPTGTTFKYLTYGVYGYNDGCGGVDFSGTNVAGATVLTFNANNETYGDPCGGTYKYLRVIGYYNNR